MDISHLYSTRPIKSVDEDRADIIVTFRELLKKNKTSVKLINYHHGLPLSYSASIVSVEHGMVDLDIHPQQAAAFERENLSFVRCDAFPHSVGASVHYINVRKRAATLTGFFFAEILAEQRNSIRLMLNPLTEAAFDVDGIKFQGSLYDLSLGGASILLEERPDIPDDADIKLHFMLPNLIQNTHTILTTAARHVTTKESGNKFICSFVIVPDKTVEQHISQYMFQRQVEIIRELKESSA